MADPPPPYEETPIDPSPKYTWWDLTGLCPGGMDIRSCERVIFKLLVYHFNTDIKSAALTASNIKYDSNPYVSTLRIVPFSAWDGGTDMKKPSLILKRGNQTSERLLIGDHAHRNTDIGAGTYAFSRQITGEHYVICTSAHNGQIEELAVETFNALTAYSPAVRAMLPFIDFSVTGVTPVQHNDELIRSLSSAVKIQYKYEQGWTISQ
jgi:hypothetical protein